MNTAEAIETTHAWVETIRRYPRDATLRRFGFTIHARPKSGPALWEKGGKQYTETQALVLADRMMAEETRRQVK